MGRIRVLPAELANKIAAGEVVERPASVVKELIENALDAGATRVIVRVAGGGRQLIEVEDDGCGMPADDAALALERHATSKLEDVGGLFGIKTLGFRGEALPSIASVSKLTLITSPREGGDGSRIEVDGGVLRSRGPIACTGGTTVKVEDLFFNVPARRKFLRAPETEMAHIVRIVASYGLAFSEVGFRLISGGREAMRIEPEDDVAARAAVCLGSEIARGATQVARDLGGIGLRAILPSFDSTRGNRDAQYTFVNRRAVRDRVLSHAIALAYDGLLPKGRHPALCLFLEIDPARVDVNVHPTKAEVRLLDSQRVHQAVAGALRSAYLGRGEVARIDVEPARPGASPQLALRSLAFPDAPQTASPPRVAEALPAAIITPRSRTPCPRPADPEDLESYLPGPSEVPRLIGQYRRTFLVGSDSAGLLLIDQHVAHERVLYERAFASLALGDAERQPLLTPALLDLDPGRAALLALHRDQIEALGFSIEDMGHGGFAVRAMPSYLKGAAVPLLSELLEDLAQEPREPRSLDVVRHDVAASIACRAAVKAHRIMSPEEQTKLVADLWRCENRYHCPHGRPVLLRITYDQIARHFERH